ncbi:MAG: serine/threonine protein kinase [Candidatus Obscuribacterales bacterium]|nr:serine/threonine protein kinase [Candidatus Obscuribacterales bacterium]
MAIDKTSNTPSDSNSSNFCPKCKLRRVDQNRLGSITSFVLVDLSCRCDMEEASPVAVLSGKKAQSRLCRRCHKLAGEQSAAGSITGFFFKAQRCQCRKPLLTGNENLSTRFRTKPKSKKNRETNYGFKTGFAGENSQLKQYIKPGTVIGNAFKLLVLVGEGGMGSVYKAKHIATGRTCAVKLLAPDLISQESFKRFKEEAKIAASLNHPSICHIYDLGVDQDLLPFYAMDYVDGANLQELIVENGPLSVGATLEIFIEICEGLAYAHRKGVIHKDLKPANFMLFYEEDESLGLKILDFGISELEFNRWHDSEIVGSAAYMSPEQFRVGAVDKRSDIYSLGISMFETLTGEPPFVCESFEAYQQAHQNLQAPSLGDKTGVEFPTEVEAIISKCLEKQTERRYQSASELAIDLKRVMENKPLQFADEVLLFDAESSERRERNERKEEAKTATATATKETIWKLFGGFSLAILFVGIIYLSLYNLLKTDNEITKKLQNIASPESFAPSGRLLDGNWAVVKLKNGISINLDKFGYGQLRTIDGPLPADKGKIELPADTRLVFIPNQAFMTDRGAWSNLDLMPFWEIRIPENYQVEPDAFAMLIDTTPDQTHSLVLRKIESDGRVPDYSSPKLYNIDIGFARLNGCKARDFTQRIRSHRYALDGQSPDEMDQAIKSIKWKDSVFSLRLDHCKLKDSTLKELTKLPNLRTLEVRNCDIDNKRLDLISKIKHLKRLHLGEAKLGPGADIIVDRMHELQYLSVNTGKTEQVEDELWLMTKLHSVEFHPKDDERDDYSEIRNLSLAL